MGGNITNLGESRHEILLVEDNRTIQLCTSQWLNKLHCNVDIAENSENVEKMVAEKKYGDHWEMECLETGANDFKSKPLDILDSQELLRAWVLGYEY